MDYTTIPLRLIYNPRFSLKDFGVYDNHPINTPFAESMLKLDFVQGNYAERTVLRCLNDAYYYHHNGFDGGRSSLAAGQLPEVLLHSCPPVRFSFGCLKKNPEPRRLGAIMTKLWFVKERSGHNSTRGYYVREHTQSEIEQAHNPEVF